MSRLYDTVEPAVIDEEMLKKAVEEQGPKEEAGKIAKQEGIDFGDVLSLRLDFLSKYMYQYMIVSIMFSISMHVRYDISGKID